MRIAIIDCDDISDPQRKRFISYPHMFVCAFDKIEPPISYEVFSALEQQLPNEVTGFDGWLIMGSKFGAYDKVPWIDELKIFTKKLIAADQRLAGICFGHQLIHLCLGGEVRKSSRGWGIGVHNYQVKQRPYFVKRAPEQLALIVSHQDQVEVPASGTVVIAGSEFCPNAICTIGKNIFTCQSHPEFTLEYIHLIMNIRRPIIGDDLVDAGEVSLAQSLDSDLLLQWLAKFWQERQPRKNS